jgi:hypothetical protein
MINAADDLATALLQALIALQDAYSACLNHGFVNAQNQATIRCPETGEIPSEIEDALKRSEGLNAQAHARSARISLLFGNASPADRAALLTHGELTDALKALNSRPVPDYESYRDSRQAAQEFFDAFTDRALKEIKGQPWYERLWVAIRLRRLDRKALRAQADRGEGEPKEPT